MIELTRILDQVGKGDAGAAEQLAGILYDELRGIARREMAGERPDHTLQPTALVHEAYMRLVNPDGVTFENRAHFFGAAAAAIRRVLVEHARNRARAKRGGGRARVGLEAVDPEAPMQDETLLSVDEAVQQLATFDADAARIVELRFFAGMTIPETAKLLGVSESTVEREWRIARAWLHGELEDVDGP